MEPTRSNSALGPTPRWTFSVSALMLWTALVGFIMAAVRLSPDLGIAVGIFSVPAAVSTVIFVLNHKRMCGERLPVCLTVHWFIVSFAFTPFVLFVGGVSLIGAISLAVDLVNIVLPARYAAIVSPITGWCIGISLAILILVFFIRAARRRK